MIREYEIVGEKVVITGEQGKMLRDNVDNIDEILKAENYIEYLEKTLVKCRTKSNDIKVMSNRTAFLHTAFKVLFGIGATAVIALILNLINFGGADPIANTIFGPMSTRFFQVLATEAIMSPAFGFYINLCYQNHKNAVEEKEKFRKIIRFLELKIAEEKRDLTVLKDQSEVSHIARTPNLSMESYNEGIQSLVERQMVAASYRKDYEGRETEIPDEEGTLEYRPYVMRQKNVGGRL